MPTYAYACTECGHRFETVQSFTDDALTECPECAGRLRKVFSNVGIVFKGSGFYRNDSRTDAKSGSSAESTPEKKSDTKTETKAETKTGTKAETTTKPDSKPATSGQAAAAS